MGAFCKIPQFEHQRHTIKNVDRIIDKKIDILQIKVKYLKSLKVKATISNLINSTIILINNF